MSCRPKSSDALEVTSGIGNRSSGLRFGADLHRRLGVCWVFSKGNELDVAREKIPKPQEPSNGERADHAEIFTDQKPYDAIKCERICIAQPDQYGWLFMANVMK